MALIDVRSGRCREFRGLKNVTVIPGGCQRERPFAADFVILLQVAGFTQAPGMGRVAPSTELSTLMPGSLQ